MVSSNKTYGFFPWRICMENVDILIDFNHSIAQLFALWIPLKTKTYIRIECFLHAVCRLQITKKCRNVRSLSSWCKHVHIYIPTNERKGINIVRANDVGERLVFVFIHFRQRLLLLLLWNRIHSMSINTNCTRQINYRNWLLNIDGS